MTFRPKYAEDLRIAVTRIANILQSQPDLDGAGYSGFTIEHSETTPINTLWATFKKKCFRSMSIPSTPPPDTAKEGIVGNIHVELKGIWTSGSGGDVV